MKLLSQRGISVAPPEHAAVSGVPTASSVPSISAAPSAPSVPVIPAVPAIHAISAISAVSAIPAVLAVPTAVSAAVPAVAVPTALLTPGDEPADISMESPPRPEGSSRATGGILRNRAMGQEYNPVMMKIFKFLPS